MIILSTHRTVPCVFRPLCLPRTVPCVFHDANNQLSQRIEPEQYNPNHDALTLDNDGICTVNAYSNNTVGHRYTYDTNGNVLTYTNPANNYTENTYDEENRLIKTVTYETANAAEGLVTRYVYDEDGNLIQTVYPHQYNAAYDGLEQTEPANTYSDSNAGEQATYDDNGNIVSYTDSFGKVTANTYDAGNHLVKSVTDEGTTRFVYNGGDHLLQVIYPDRYHSNLDNLDLNGETPVDTYSDPTVGDRYTYDDHGNVVTYTDRFGNVTTYTYDPDGNLTATTKLDVATFAFNDDGKVTSETYANGLIRNYSYTENQTVVSGSNGITTTHNLNAFGEIAEYLLQNGENNKNYAYTYDSNGNILTISLNNTLQQTFTYNDSNELIRVDDAVANQSVTYTYDYVGNITSVNTYAYTTGALGTPLTTETYTYNSQNQRTDLTYDSAGNLTGYNGFAFTWTGRKLTSAANTGNTISYDYHSNGIRTSKTVNGTATYYEVDENNNVVKQYNLVNNEETNVMKFVYDSSHAPIYFTYDNAAYYYEKNLQGDIVGILDSNGSSVVQYTYDIWGKLLGTTGTLASTIGEINPLRYRGYYYDTETELYYLQSRYYSPELMRFISQDDPVLSNNQGEPLGSNLYAYCLNNPVNHSDPAGNATDQTWNLVWLLIKNLVKTKLWKCIPIYGKIKFYNAVKDKGIWDYKRTNRQPDWAKSGKFRAFGITMTTEQLGNFNFGFTGASMGFSPTILFAGGGFVAIKHHAPWRDWKYFFDTKEDHLWIALGIFAYSVFDLQYAKKSITPAYKYALEKVAFTMCLAIYKYFK